MKTRALLTGLVSLILLAVASLFFVLGAMETADLHYWKSVSEIASNMVGVLALVGVAWAIMKWFSARRDRTADVLINLARRFDESDIRAGREIIDFDREYDKVKPGLVAAIADKSDRLSSPPLRAVDALLRFYVLLCGLIKSGQVDIEGARICFRYYLCLYHDTGRTEFRAYVDKYFPTLRDWLADRDFVTPKDIEQFCGQDSR